MNYAKVEMNDSRIEIDVAWTRRAKASGGDWIGRFVLGLLPVGEYDIQVNQFEVDRRGQPVEGEATDEKSLKVVVVKDGGS